MTGRGDGRSWNPRRRHPASISRRLAASGLALVAGCGLTPGIAHGAAPAGESRAAPEAKSPPDPNAPASTPPGVRPTSSSPGTAPIDPNSPIHAGTETVEVTGSGRDAAGAATSFVTIIRPEDFAGRVVTLADLLGEAPGVRVRQYGGLNSFATAMIRGSSADQTLVCVDGVPLNSPLGGAVNLADVPLAGLEAIEIHRGFAPSSLGASSLGGAVNIRTRRPEEGKIASGSFSYGSYRTATASGFADFRTGPLRWAGSAESTGSGGGFAFLDNNGTEETNRDDVMRRRANNASWSAALRLKAEAPLASGQVVTLSTEWLRRRQGVPGIDAFESLHAGYALQRGLIRAGTTWGGHGPDGWSLSTAIDHEYASQAFEDPATGIGPSAQDRATRITGTGATLRLDGRPSPSQRFSFLLEPRSQRADVFDHLDPTPDPIHARRRSIDAVVEDEIHAASGRLLVAPSLRYDLIDDSSRGGAPGPDPDPTPALSSFSGRLGGLYALSARWALRGNVGRFYHAPDLTARYGDEGSIVGNPDLLPEKGLNADLGVSYSGGRAGAFDRIGLELSAFRTDADDLIQLLPLPNRTLKAFNIGRARVTGVESGFGFRVAGRLVLSMNYTRQKPIDLSDSPTRGRDLIGRPRVEAGASESLPLGRVTIFHRLAYVGANDISAVSGLTGNFPAGRGDLTRLPARYLHDAGFRFKAGRVEVSAEVDNLLDRRVVDVARYPLPGRAFFVKIATAL